jgi:hypothetical protein
MAKRRARVKLSRAQQLENDTNKWLAKRDAAISMLVKAMGKLMELERSTRRVQKAALHPVQRKIADKLNATTKPTATPTNATATATDRGQRLEAMGFRRTRKSKAAAAITG